MVLEGCRRWLKAVPSSVQANKASIAIMILSLD